MPRNYAVLILADSAWDQDRVVAYYDTREAANQEAERLVEAWHSTIAVARIVSKHDRDEDAP
jgi:hypothetical protein